MSKIKAPKTVNLFPQRVKSYEVYDFSIVEGSPQDVIKKIQMIAENWTADGYSELSFSVTQSYDWVEFGLTGWRKETEKEMTTRIAKEKAAISKAQEAEKSKIRKLIEKLTPEEQAAFKKELREML